MEVLGRAAAYETELGAGGRLDLGNDAAIPPKPTGESGIEGHSYRVAYAPPISEVVRVLVDDEPVGSSRGADSG